ncbi:MAG: hypothetical protein ACC645_10185 [Pirellulales bacterium]
MSLDPYASCPCGSGKKLKFCCSHLTSEMEKISRMLEGDQRAACLQHIKVIQPKHPAEPSLMGLRAMLELEMEQFDNARETIRVFLEAHPNHPVGLAEKATLLAVAGDDLPAAVDGLQEATSVADGEVSEQLYEAIGTVGAALLEQGQIMSGLAHIVLQARMSGSEDKRPIELLMALQSEDSIPLLLKDEILLSPCDPQAAWHEPFNEANGQALQGQWKRAAASLEAIIDQHGDAPELWRNLALVRAWQAKRELAIDALRHYATLDVPLDDAVEAEAMAALLDEKNVGERIDVLRCTFPIHQLEALEVALSGDTRLERMDVGSVWSSHEDEPPPRSAFRLLSQPLLMEKDELAIDKIPETLGQLMLFGKQTDRPARLELFLGRDHRMEETVKLLRAIGDDALGEMEKEEAVTEVPLVAHLLTRGWIFPATISLDDRQRMLNELIRRVVLEEWFRHPMKILDGKSLAEAASDTKLRLRVLAQILLLEQSRLVDGLHGLNGLRTDLGLPTTGPIDPEDTVSNRLPLVRLHRVVFKKLTDDQLLALWRRAVMARFFRAADGMAEEIVARENLRDSPHGLEAISVLVRSEKDSDQRLALIQQGMQIAEAQKESTGPWDLRELMVRIERNEEREVRRVLEHLLAEHRYEPGVMESLQKVMLAAGMVRPAPRAGGGPVPEVVETVVTPGTSAEETGKIWTPDQQGGGGGEKKTIWTPGDV